MLGPPAVVRRQSGLGLAFGELFASLVMAQILFEIKSLKSVCLYQTSMQMSICGVSFDIIVMERRKVVVEREGEGGGVS